MWPHHCARNNLKTLHPHALLATLNVARTMALVFAKNGAESQCGVVRVLRIEDEFMK
jgi:hypothetical protein